MGTCDRGAARKLLGAKQITLAAALVEKLMKHADSVHLVRLTTSGKNAVDFALSYYLGRAAVANPAASFHIISQDKGYDSLIEHLRSRQVNVRRHDDFQTLTFSGPAKPSPAPSEDLFIRALEHLRRNLNNRPKRKKTLASQLLAFAGKMAAEAEILLLIEKLRMAGHISLNDKDAVTYHG